MDEIDSVVERPALSGLTILSLALKSLITILLSTIINWHSSGSNIRHIDTAKIVPIALIVDFRKVILVLVRHHQIRLGNLKRGHLEMGGKLRSIVKYTSTYQSKALLLLFRMVIIGAMIDDHIVVVFTLE